MAPNQIGPFEILRTLGRIEEKRVFKAASAADGKVIAVRPIRADGERLCALLNAARRAMALDSQNIVQVQEVEESGAETYVVTEYVEGNNLRSLLKQNAEVSVWEVTDIARQICSAIDHARLRHLAHGNLTPANIMIEWDGMVKVMDYETLTDPKESHRSGRNSEALHYLSPEQARGEQPDWRSNVFSLGAILYELLTGEKAFPGADAPEILKNITSKDPAAPHLAKATVNSGLSSVIMKALSKTPEGRYQSGTELIRDLEDRRKPGTASAPASAKAANLLRRAEERPKLPSPIASKSADEQPEVVVPRTAVSIGIRPPQSFPPPDQPASSPIASAPSTLRIRSLEPVVAETGSEEPPAETIQKAAAVVRKRVKARISPSVFLARHRAFLLYTLAGALLLVASFGLGRGIGDVIRAHVRPSQSTAPAAEQPQPMQSAPIVEEATAAHDDTPAVRSGHRPGKKRVAPVIAASPALMIGELTIESSPQGATIQLDGRGASFQTPYIASGLGVGRHTVVLSKQGYTTESRTIEIVVGLRSRLMIALTEIGATVSIASDPSGAKVFIDGQDSGRTTPVAVMLKKGSHTLNLRKAGYLQSDTKVELAAGQSFQFAPHLSPLGNEDDIKAVGKFTRILGRHSRSGMATLQIRSNPRGARIIVNQRVLDKTTPAEFSVPEGSYEIALALDGYSRAERTISVVGGATLVVNESLQK